MILFCLTIISLPAADDALTRTNELGPVEVTTTLSPSKPTIGDEVVLEIVVKAEADVDVLMPEFGEALSRYTILDFVPKQRVASDGATIYSQRYTLQPYVSGTQSIPPILVEFVDHRDGQKPAPDDLDAYEILTDRLDFEVKSVLPTSAGTELNPPLGELELVRASSRSRTAYAIVATIALIIALGAGFAFWRYRHQQMVRRDPYDEARQRLDRLLARQTPQTGDEIETFYVEISAIIRRYLEDRFELRAPELTTEEFLTVAGRCGALSREHQQLLREFLRQADLVKFAGLHASRSDIDLSTQLAVRFLEETRGPVAQSSDAHLTPPAITADSSGRHGDASAASGADPREDSHV